MKKGAVFSYLTKTLFGYMIKNGRQPQQGGFMFARVLQILQKSFREAPEGSVSTLFVAGAIISFSLESGEGAGAVILFCIVFGLVMGMSFGIMTALALVAGGMLAMLFTTQPLYIVLMVLGGTMILIGVTGASDIFYKKNVGKEQTPAP